MDITRARRLRGWDERQSSSREERSMTTQSNIEELLQREGVELGDAIGRGTFSDVRRAWSHRLRAFVAVKMIDRRTSTDFVRHFLPRELLIVQQLRHPNIVRVHHLLDAGPVVCLVQEYAEHGDLLRLIKRRRRLPETDARPLFRQLIEALEYLRRQEIAHRDVKCENVFLDRNDNVKLGDFGFARWMRAADVSKTFCGSRAYVAPEILRAEPYSGSGCDIWSAGVVLYVMVTGVMPYDDRNPRHMIEKQLQHRVTFPRFLGHLISHDARLLVYIMLHPDPTRRAKYADIVNSAWLVHTSAELRTARVVESQVGAASPSCAVPLVVSVDKK
uniref:Protein kinase domain-containing protein n=1 Tax=Plectus sambesii TaxID=2011161 RepID=A0A914XP03_9BILA